MGGHRHRQQHNDVCAAAYGGTVYKQAGGSGSFSAIDNNTSRSCLILAIDQDAHNVYGGVNSEYVYTASPLITTYQVTVTASQVPLLQ